jgi:hypothetical protein
MPTMAVILARVRPNDCSDVNIWRRDLLNAFDPSHFSPFGPLRLMDDRKWEKPPINDDSLWLNVGVECPTYEEGYERGDPELFVRLAEWLERRIPGCEVWYGNDADDASVQPFHASRRKAMLEHFREVGHEPYDSKFPRANGG